MDIAAGQGKSAILGASIVISYLYGEWSVMLGALIFFVSFDYLTGVIAAAYNGKLNAETGFWGIAKKFLVFGIVALAYQVDLIFIDLTGAPLSLGEFGISVMGVTIVYYLFNESLSITENVGRCGVSFPPGITRAMEVFNQKEGDKK